jgi:hypothetical protein
VSLLQDACNELWQRLNQAEAECQIILAGLIEFEGHADLYVISRLMKKLLILDQWILSETKRLYVEHQGNGYVCFFLTERDGLTAYWVEDEKIGADKARWVSYGAFVISPEAALDFIRQLGEHLKFNDWPTVVDWLRKYGKSPGLAAL